MLSTTAALGVVTGRWRRLVLQNPQLGHGELDRRAYSFCVLEALQTALSTWDVFVTKSGRFTDPRAKLLSGVAWQTARPEICAGLELASEPSGRSTSSPLSWTVPTGRRPGAWTRTWPSRSPRWPAPIAPTSASSKRSSSWLAEVVP